MQEIASDYPAALVLGIAKAPFDELFALYRYVLTGLLLVALAVIACGAVARLGWRKRAYQPGAFGTFAGLRSGSAGDERAGGESLFATGAGAGAWHRHQLPLFFSNPRGTPLTSLLAITLAMLTTLLALGMLGIQRHPGHQQFWHCAGERYFHRLPAFAAGYAR